MTLAATSSVRKPRYGTLWWTAWIALAVFAALLGGFVYLTNVMVTSDPNLAFTVMQSGDTLEHHFTPKFTIRVAERFHLPLYYGVTSISYRAADTLAEEDISDSGHDGSEARNDLAPITSPLYVGDQFNLLGMDDKKWTFISSPSRPHSSTN